MPTMLLFNRYKLAVVALALLIIGYTTSTFAANNPRDPYETFNRHAYHLNKTIDKIIFKPIATIIKKGVTNFFNNVSQVPTVANDLLQANFHQAKSDAWRFLINSSIGVLGIFDVASSMNIPFHSEDVGLTFAHWGMKESSYLVLPLWGSSTVRDAIGLPINYYLTIYPHLNDTSTRNWLFATNTVNQRSNLLHFEKVIKQAAFDQYVFERDAYFQRRQYSIAHIKQSKEAQSLAASAPQP
jgi:phospholipid-binding lipoprotein MlaA